MFTVVTAFLKPSPLFIPRILSSIRIETVYSSKNIVPNFLLAPGSGNYYPAICLYEFTFFTLAEFSVL